MTPKEKKVLKTAGELWDQARLLPEEHPDDINDIRFHIHAIQNIILARDGLRSLKPKK